MDQSQFPERPNAPVDQASVLTGLQRTPSNEVYSALEKFRPFLLKIANAEIPELMRQKVGASDLVQDTMIKGAELCSRFSGSTDGQLRAWLRAILFRVLSDYRKKFDTQKRNLGKESIADSQVVCPGNPSPLESMLTRENLEVLAVVISKLPENYREIIELRHRRSLSFAEIGKRMQITEDAARKCWKRAVDQFRKELQRHDAEFGEWLPSSGS